MDDMDVTSDMGSSLPFMLTVEEAYTLLRIGKTKGRELVRRYEETGGAEGIPFITIGRCQRVLRDEFLDRVRRGVIEPSSAGVADELAPRRQRSGADGGENDREDHGRRSVSVGGRAAGRLARRPRRESPPDQLPLFPAG